MSSSIIPCLRALGCTALIRVSTNVDGRLLRVDACRLCECGNLGVAITSAVAGRHVGGPGNL